jgi:hypothetical protein
MRQIISSQNKPMWWLRAFVATWAMSHSRAYCRKSRFVTNTRFFGFVLSRLLLRHLGFDSDFAQISAQKISGWGLCKRHLLHSHLRSVSFMNFSTHDGSNCKISDPWNAWVLISLYLVLPWNVTVLHLKECLMSWYRSRFMFNEICPNLMLLDLLLGF